MFFALDCSFEGRRFLPDFIPIYGQVCCHRSRPGPLGLQPIACEFVSGHHHSYTRGSLQRSAPIAIQAPTSGFSWKTQQNVLLRSVEVAPLNASYGANADRLSPSSRRLRRHTRVSACTSTWRLIRPLSC